LPRALLSPAFRVSRREKSAMRSQPICQSGSGAVKFVDCKDDTLLKFRRKRSWGSQPPAPVRSLPMVTLQIGAEPGSFASGFLPACGERAPTGGKPPQRTVFPGASFRNGTPRHSRRESVEVIDGASSSMGRSRQNRVPPLFPPWPHGRPLGGGA
jgi:hypothetical protein